MVLGPVTACLLYSMPAAQQVAHGYYIHSSNRCAASIRESHAAGMVWDLPPSEHVTLHDWSLNCTQPRDPYWRAPCP
jgi:hypothetical protein